MESERGPSVSESVAGASVLTGSWVTGELVSAEVGTSVFSGVGVAVAAESEVSGTFVLVG